MTGKGKFRSIKPIWRSDSEEDGPIRQSEPYLNYAERQIVLTQLTVPIDEDISSPKYYRHVCDRISQLGKHDEVKFMINSCGGNMDGLCSILDALADTEAESYAFLQGECHSAASILALHCDNISVSPYSTMMVHYVSFGSQGQGAQVRDRVQHILDFSEKLFRDTYEGFLTEDEINDAIEGKEIWLMSDEIGRRLALRAELLQEREEDTPAEPDEEESFPALSGIPIEIPSIGLTD